MRLKLVIYILIILIFLSACQKQITPTAITPIVEPSIIGLAAPDIGQPTASAPSDQMRHLLRQELARRGVLSAGAKELAVSGQPEERHAASPPPDYPASSIERCAILACHSGDLFENGRQQWLWSTDPVRRENLPAAVQQLAEEEEPLCLIR